MRASLDRAESIHAGVEMDAETAILPPHERHRRKTSSTSPCPINRRATMTTFIQYHLRNRSKSLASASSIPKPLRELCTSDELMNYWKDLPMDSKRCLLRIHRHVFLKALDQFLIRQHLCFECHENVIAEWEDFERRRAPRKRSLLDVFTVIPPFMDSEEEDDEDFDMEEDDPEAQISSGIEHSCQHFQSEEKQTEAFSSTDAPLLHHNHNETSILREFPCIESNCEDELLRLLQNEERYILLVDEHADLMDDLVRCGEQFEYLMPLLRSNEIPIGVPSRLYDDDYYYDGGDSIDCPGASTPRSAQEYLLDLLAVQFREKLEMAYHEAIRHSLAAQAELLREEGRIDRPLPSKPARKKKKKRKKSQGTDRSELDASRHEKTQFECSFSDGIGTELDREVEEFRLLLERIHEEGSHQTRRKLVLPPGTFASCWNVEDVESKK